MNNSLPIHGQRPTSFKCREVYDPDSDGKKRSDKLLRIDKLFAEIDNEDIINVSVFPPHPLEFTVENYKPFHRYTTPLTVAELYSKIHAVDQESLLVILHYDRFSKNKFDVEPMEIISMIDYSEDEKELRLYSVYYRAGKMIESSQLQSTFVNDNDGKVSMLKRLHNKVFAVPDNTPIFLLSKSEGKLNVTDVITFRASAMLAEKNYIGIVVEEDVFIPDCIYED